MNRPERKKRKIGLRRLSEKTKITSSTEEGVGKNGRAAKTCRKRPLILLLIREIGSRNAGQLIGWIKGPALTPVKKDRMQDLVRVWKLDTNHAGRWSAMAFPCLKIIGGLRFSRCTAVSQAGRFCCFADSERLRLKLPLFLGSVFSGSRAGSRSYSLWFSLLFVVCPPFWLAPLQ